MGIMKSLRLITGAGLVFYATLAGAKVGIVTGPTPIDQGMAIHQDDFTIYNDKIAASFAVGSNNYWNMTNGSILDIAIMRDGKFGTDLTNDVGFLNDLWTSTGVFNNENLLKTPAKNINWKVENDKIIVTAKTRYWTAGHKLPLNVTIEYTLEDHKNYIRLKTTVENPAGNENYENVYSGYSISTLAANMFGPFGYYPDLKITGIGIGADKDVNQKYGEFVVTYGNDYAVSVQLDGADAYKGSSGYKDVYINRTIEAGKTYVYSGELLVSDKGETASIIERYLERDNSIPAATLTGQVKNSKGAMISNAYVIISTKGTYKETRRSHGADKVKKEIMQPFIWTITDKNGHFSVHLPQGEYQLHTEAQGYTPSNIQSLNLTQNSQLDFVVKAGAKAVLTAVDEQGQPTDFKVAVSGTTSTVKSLGGTVFFTDTDNHVAAFDVAAPETPVTLTFTRADGFDSLPVIVTRNLKPGETIQEKVTIPALIATRSRNWYSVDTHQHADFGDGATPVGELYKAQVAAGLDFTVVADHGSVANNRKMEMLSQKGGQWFVSNIEVSPGWGHWGIIGMDYNQPPVSADLTPAEIIKAGHAMGALVVVHHPYSDYGFFNNRDSVKGGYDKGSEDFDLLELQSTIDLADAKNMDKQALELAMRYWNAAQKKYLTGGSDQHDVTSGLYPGIIRTYVNIDGEVSTDKFFTALKAGHSYITMGPIFTPAKNTLFGSVQEIQQGHTYTLNTELQSVNGLARIDVYSEGKIISSESFGDTTEAVNYRLEVKPVKNTWYSFVAMDTKGHYAVTNPVWVNVR